jgi:hypothetical protein
MNRAVTFFDAAEKAVATDRDQSLRVRRERLPLDHIWLLRYKGLKRQAGMTGSEFLGPKDPVAACEAFIRAVHGSGYSEGSKPAVYEDHLRRLVRSAARDRSTRAIPAECQKLDAKDWLDIQDSEFDVCYDDKIKTIDDPMASDGKALNIPPAASSVRFTITGDVLDVLPQPSHGYLRVRCDAGAKVGPAYTVGICYAPVWEGKDILTRTVNLEGAGDGRYHTIDLGVHHLKKGMFLWIKPTDNPAAVKSISIDRMFLVGGRLTEAEPHYDKKE